MNRSHGPEKGGVELLYRDMPKALELRVTMQSVNNAGVVTMQNQGRMQARYGLHRVGEEQNDPQWQERGVYMKATFQLLAPAQTSKGRCVFSQSAR